MFREVARESLDADSAVCFVLDDSLRLIYCNPAWDQFALQNGGRDIRRDALLGTPVLSSTSGEVLRYYRSLFYDVLVTRNPREHDFHCSSPDVQRLMRMSIYRLRNTPALLVTCSTRVEQPHTEIPFEPVQELYRDQNGFIVMCGNCRRTRRPAGESETWDWIPGFVANTPQMVSHGLCGLCLQYHYPDLA